MVKIVGVIESERGKHQKLTAKIKQLEAEFNICEKLLDETREDLYKEQAENQRLTETYNDLIMSVECKYNDETRHETAKRYIVEREQKYFAKHKASGRAVQKALKGE